MQNLYRRWKSLKTSYQAALIILFGVVVTLSNNWISFATHNYQSELYPTRVRARAVGFVYSWSRISAARAGLLIGFFLQQGGTMGVALFIGACAAGLAWAGAGAAPPRRRPAAPARRWRTPHGTTPPAVTNGATRAWRAGPGHRSAGWASRR